MVEEADALARILVAARPIEATTLPLREALGFFLAKPIRSTLAHPRFDNSVVDGYAIRVEDGLGKRKIIGEQPAGQDRSLRLETDEAIRIFTGAPIPEGCNGVVMQEDITVDAGQFILQKSVELGENIRRKGADLAAGQLIARVGDRVTPQLIGLLASQGLATVTVHQAPRVVILLTGDELRHAGAQLAPGEIYDSNSGMLSALLQPLGIFADVRHCPDDRDALEIEIQKALSGNDVLIISGGVSVGDHDHVRPALTNLGIKIDLWQIRMKPGKPLAFAQVKEKLIFGLPGNPVASFVTFLVLVRPALLQMLGAQDEDRFLSKRFVQLASEISNPGKRPHYIRGNYLNGRFICNRLQESHALFGLSQSNALLRVEAETHLLADEEYKVLVW